jgi:predicted aminopeptidase
MTWCFPVVGCVAYRGYFAPTDARNYAMRLKARGLDVAVGGVAAYSTLGWFDDPLPNTVINRPEAELAGLIFHELAHQVVYVSDDTAFNESFATTVELEGTRRWFAHTGNAQQARKLSLGKEREQEVIALILDTRAELKNLYQSGLAAAPMRERKQQAFARLKARYQRLRSGWDGDGRFDAWFARPLNNAHLVSVGAYHQYVEAFSRLLALQDDDIERFFREVRNLGRLPAPERHARLVAIQKSGPSRPGG